MIERLELQNFQAHEIRVVEFSPKTTSITGPSDIGKSAIIRALRWICNNQPQGDAFVRHGAKGAQGILTVDGHTITRRRFGEENTYHLDGQEFKSFSANVPDPILKVLNLNETNWQRQHDAPYWFSETAGEVSRQLNAVVDLGVIDKALYNINSAFTEARNRLVAAKTRLEAAKTAVAGLEWVNAATVGVQDLEGRAARMEALHDRASVLEATIKQWNESDRQYALLAQATAELDSVVERCRLAGLAAKKVEVLRGMIVSLKSVTAKAIQHAAASREALAAAILGRDWSRLVSRIEVLQELLHALRKRTVVPPVEYDVTLAAAFEAVSSLYRRTASLVQAIDAAQDAQDTYEIRAEKAKKSREQLEQYTGGKCPLCGSPVEGDVCLT